MSLPLELTTVWFSSRLCRRAAKAALSIWLWGGVVVLQAGNCKPGRCAGSLGQSSAQVSISCLPLAHEQGHCSWFRGVEPPPDTQDGKSPPFPFPKRVWILFRAMS